MTRRNLMNEPDVRGAAIADQFARELGRPLGSPWIAACARGIARDIRAGQTPDEAEYYRRVGLGLDVSDFVFE